MDVADIGRIVRYTLTAHDAERINRRREDFLAFCREHPRPDEPGDVGATGHIGHIGNPMYEGDEFPAMIVKVWDGDMTNLQVFLDGNDVYWAMSRRLGLGAGTWKWPVRA